jgi:3D (Asp-Asp-Asp) domain-containing protein
MKKINNRRLIIVGLILFTTFAFISNEIRIWEAEHSIIVLPPEHKHRIVVVTAYTLRPEETDNTPCLTAYGNICGLAKVEQLCATRLYPLGTRLRVGNIECLVVDRPAIQNSHIVDILMKTVNEALRFGRQRLPVEVVDN